MSTDDAAEHPPIDRGRSSAAREAAAAWASLLGSAYALEPLPRVTNPVWQVSTAALPPMVLKQLPLYAPGVDPVTEHRVLTHLLGRGVRVACPVVTDAGSVTALVDGRHWQLQPSLPHRSAPEAVAVEDAGLAATVGSAIGHLDRALASYPGPVGSYTDDPVATLAEVVPELPVELTRLVDPLAGHLHEALADLPRQLTHGDCNDGNVLIGPDGGVGFIDLDHVPVGPRVRDLAYYLASRLHRARADAARTAVAAALPHYLDGYRDSHPLGTRERAALVPLMLLTEIAGAHWALHGWDPDHDEYRRHLATTAWITRRYDQLLASVS
ncbi:phosphotransferase enzyme family protein [Desertihabitans aurantiacus]|uniref:phosphotransferase enzyme family protein n=1 Tax=Desertihabitans aurantiacus TaxID=2282477 RepID=UPI000DF7E296|nr:phosphotransferase [Desertihabitans aurantiacus]